MAYFKAIFIFQIVFVALINAQYETNTHLNEQPFRHDACPLNDDPAHPIQLAYVYDCNKYYSCMRGWAYLLSCPPGLQWSLLTYRCDYPEVAKCQPVTLTNTPVKPPINPPINTPISPPINAPNNPPINTPISPPFNSPNNPPIDPPINPLIYPQLTQTPNPAYYSSYAAGLAYPSNPLDCSKYYQCQVLQCPAQTLWSARLQRCDLPIYATCFTNQPQTLPTTTLAYNSLEYLPYPNDCSKYLQCHLMECPAQTLWSAYLQRCDSPAYASCNAFQPAPTATLPPYVPTFTTQQSISLPPKAATPPPTLGPNIVPQPWNPFDNQTVTDASPSNNPNQKELNQLCSQPGAEYMPYPGNCHRFVQCNGIAFVRDCPANLYWNSELLTCDHYCK